MVKDKLHIPFTLKPTRLVRHALLSLLVSACSGPKPNVSAFRSAASLSTGTEFFQFCVFADRLGDDDSVDVRKGANVECAVGANSDVRVKGARVQGDVKSLAARANIGPSSTVEGNVFSDQDTIVRDSSVIHGNVQARGDVRLLKNASIDGDATAMGSIVLGSGALVTGTTNEGASIPPIEPMSIIPAPTLPAGELDIKVKSRDIKTLEPGSYGELEVRKEARLNLQSGHYAFRDLTLGEGSILHIDLSSGPIVVDVEGEIDFKARVTMTLAGGDASQVLFQAGEEVDLRDDGTYFGTYISADEEIELHKGASLTGALYGEKVDVEQNSTLIGMPAANVYRSLFPSIGGQVIDPNGVPIEGVLVSSNSSITTTNAAGLYELVGLSQEKRILVRFFKEGFAKTLGVGDLSASERITLNKTMVPAGSPQLLTAEAGGTVAQDGFTVTFAPGSLAATGDVQVVLSPIDVSTTQLRAFPGDFIGINLGGSEVGMETFSLMDIDVSQNGLPVDLKPGQFASLEFLLSEISFVGLGAPLGLWFFDEGAGFWQEEGSGTVVESSSIPDRLAVIGNVSHFSWWNTDLGIPTFACVEGTVRDPVGNLLEGAAVIATGIDYRGESTAWTDSSGKYCVNVRRSSKIQLTTYAFITNNQIVVNSTTGFITTSDDNVTCETGDCRTVVPLVVPSLTCIQGNIRDEFDRPVADATIFSSHGGLVKSNVLGTFCMAAPEGALVTIYSPGFVPVTVSTPENSTATCSNFQCVPVLLLPSLEKTCASGTAFHETGTFTSGFVTVLDLDNNLATIVLNQPINEGDAGSFCVDGIPVNHAYQFLVTGTNQFNQACNATISVSGNGISGTCGTGGCQNSLFICRVP